MIEQNSRIKDFSVENQLTNNVYGTVIFHHNQFEALSSYELPSFVIEIASAGNSHGIIWYSNLFDQINYIEIIYLTLKIFYAVLKFIDLTADRHSHAKSLIFCGRHDNGMFVSIFNGIQLIYL